MSPVERREMLVRTALPLLAAHGAAVTTGQIARAAGIGEGTLFRAFPDKQALVDACITTVLDPTGALAAIESIPLEVPLAQRLTEALEILRAHLGRMGDVLGALAASAQSADEGDAPRRPRAGRAEGPVNRSHGRQAALSAVHEAVVALIAPDRDSLRVSPETLTAALLDLVATPSRRRPADQAASDAALVDLLLHGAVRV
jgi:AcrR family transcriptional regulator